MPQGRRQYNVDTRLEVSSGHRGLQQRWNEYGRNLSNIYEWVLRLSLRPLTAELRGGSPCCALSAQKITSGLHKEASVPGSADIPSEYSGWSPDVVIIIIIILIKSKDRGLLTTCGNVAVQWPTLSQLGMHGFWPITQPQKKKKKRKKGSR